MKKKPFLFGSPKRPSVILSKPGTGAVVFRRMSAARMKHPGHLSTAASFSGDVRVNVLSLKAARQLVIVANAILRAKEAELLRQVVPLTGRTLS